MSISSRCLISVREYVGLVDMAAAGQRNNSSSKERGTVGLANEGDETRVRHTQHHTRQASRHERHTAKDQPRGGQ